MSDFRSRFTKWYCRKGYRMVYKPPHEDSNIAELIFVCPLWVRPLVELLFSPSVYYYEISLKEAEYV